MVSQDFVKVYGLAKVSGLASISCLPELLGKIASGVSYGNGFSQG